MKSVGILKPVYPVNAFIPLILYSEEDKKYYYQILDVETKLINAFSEILIEDKSSVIDIPYFNNIEIGSNAIYAFLFENDKLVYGDKQDILEQLEFYLFDNTFDPYAKVLICSYFNINSLTYLFINQSNKLFKEENFNLYLNINDYLNSNIIKDNWDISLDITQNLLIKCSYLKLEHFIHFSNDLIYFSDKSCHINDYKNVSSKNNKNFSKLVHNIFLRNEYFTDNENKKLLPTLFYGLNTIDKIFNERFIQIEGKQKLFFGNSDYLGLKNDLRIKEEVIKGIDKFNFSLISFHSLTSTLEIQLTELFEQIYRQPILMMPISNIASLAVLRTLVSQNDLVISDQYVGSNFKFAKETLKLDRTHVITIPHNCFDILERRINLFSKLYDKIWYIAESVNSIYGNFIHIKKLYDLMDKYPNFRVCLDDSNCLGWVGNHGAGIIFDEINYFHSQLYLIASLSKGFGGQGAIIVFPNEKERDVVEKASSEKSFFTNLNSATQRRNIAIAKIHLSTESLTLQADLKSRIDFFRNLSFQLRLPFVTQNNRSPIFYICTGSPELTFELAARLLSCGIFTNIVTYPIVPKYKSGLRILLTLNHSKDDIQILLYLIHELIIEILPNFNITQEEMIKQFEIFK